MDLPDEVAPVLAGFAAAVGPIAGVVGLYVGGSLATGDYARAVSDLDLVAVVAAPLDRSRVRRLRALHRQLMRAEPLAARLHCAYVPLPEIADVCVAHLSWTHGRLYRRPLTGVARAELLRYGGTLVGPPPAVLLPPVPAPALAEAVRGELAGYWRDAVRKPWLWRHDTYVDLGLLTVARAEVTLRDGRLITKREAIGRLSGWGVPPQLVREIERRRAGESWRCPGRLGCAAATSRGGWSAPASEPCCACRHPARRRDSLRSSLACPGDARNCAGMTASMRDVARRAGVVDSKPRRTAGGSSSNCPGPGVRRPAGAPDVARQSGPCADLRGPTRNLVDKRVPQYRAPVDLEPGLVQAAQDARDRAIALQQAADEAEVAYQRSLGELRASGGSPRDIANALGLTLEEVQQAVSAGLGDRIALRSSHSDRSCSFCGAPEDQARRLVAGAHASICGRCVNVARDVLSSRHAYSGTWPHLRVDAFSEAVCGLCGKRSRHVEAMVRGPDRVDRRRSRQTLRASLGLSLGRHVGRFHHPLVACICSECVELCQHVIEETIV